MRGHHPPALHTALKAKLSSGPLPLPAGSTAGGCDSACLQDAVAVTKREDCNQTAENNCWQESPTRGSDPPASNVHAAAVAAWLGCHTHHLLSFCRKTEQSTSPGGCQPGPHPIPAQLRPQAAPAPPAIGPSLSRATGQPRVPPGHCLCPSEPPLALPTSASISTPAAPKREARRRAPTVT